MKVLLLLLGFLIASMALVTACGREKTKQTPAPACDCGPDCCNDGACDCGCDCCDGDDGVGQGGDDAGGGGCSGGGCVPDYTARLAAGGMLTWFAVACQTPEFYPLETHAPVEFRLQDMANSPHNGGDGVFDSREDATGKALVLEFFFNGCPYCDQNAPNVERMAMAHPGQVVEVGIDRDDDLYEDWIRRHGQTWPVLKDGARTLAQRFGIRSYPSVVVLDRNHEVALRRTGVWNAATYRDIERTLARD